MLEVVRVAALSDNYVWLIHDAATDTTVAVDPGEAAPVIAALDARGWRAAAIWTTHWHPDHTGGNAELIARYGCAVTGPEAERAKIATLDHGVGEGDTVRIGDRVATVLETPGHTAGHIVFHFADDHLMFSGDTLFAMGCGRLFEGSAAQMFANMARFAAMPDETVVYGAHEYTLSNGRFALTVEPGNAALRARMTEVERLRDAGGATLPTTIGLERATNPFLRARDVQEFAERRAGKDAFRG
ncbi:hydroxyacylglutathione hydrolase [Sphingomonas sp. Leaf33]|uniref:hydroxyacylglutathione hydrolase n=1 Tax=Sphingomonas sp. Leaf33 TaxID=1736215 RepID=UPI0006F54D1E|nr:hydroxyacylglutathione hydrolase [Sphingomonas sp. Leaf33]KQN25882.1 hydroxyacylglutathione hydrolase [Sphingomonas sp. Leaf33]